MNINFIFLKNLNSVKKKKNKYTKFQLNKLMTFLKIDDFESLFFKRKL